MKRAIELNVNGSPYLVDVEDHATLQEVLRGSLGFTGAKEGCDGGECGACTVLLDGEAVLSCLTLAVDAAGRMVTTIEGLAQGGKLDPVQEAFIQEGAIQCGFCTPGMILSAKSLLNRNPHPSRAEIREALSGNICRCTGYAKIVKAVSKAAGMLD